MPWPTILQEEHASPTSGSGLRFPEHLSEDNPIAFIRRGVFLSAGLQAGCHQRGKHPETPRHALCPDQHGSSWSALLQILDLYQASIKATQSIKALIGEHGLAVDLIQV